MKKIEEIIKPSVDGRPHDDKFARKVREISNPMTAGKNRSSEDPINPKPEERVHPRREPSKKDVKEAMNVIIGWMRGSINEDVIKSYNDPITLATLVNKLFYASMSGWKKENGKMVHESGAVVTGECPLYNGKLIKSSNSVDRLYSLKQALQSVEINESKELVRVVNNGSWRRLVEDINNGR